MNAQPPRIRLPLLDFLTPERPVSWTVLLVFTAWSIFGTILVRVFVPRDAFAAVREATGGLVGGTLLLAVVVYLALYLVLGRWGGQRLADLGIDRRQIGHGALGTLLFWLLLQAIQAGLASHRGEPVTLHTAWADPGAGILIGTLLGQLLGNAPYEEIVYRRFFLAQTVHRLGAIRAGALRLLLAVVISQLFFWVMHWPAALEQGIPARLLVEKTDIILVAGFLFTWIYLQTRNLFLAAGYHALSNHPTPLLAEAVNIRWLSQRVCVTLLLLHLLWLIGRGLRARQTRATQEGGTG